MDRKARRAARDRRENHYGPVGGSAVVNVCVMTAGILIINLWTRLDGGTVGSAALGGASLSRCISLVNAIRPVLLANALPQIHLECGLECRGWAECHARSNNAKEDLWNSRRPDWPLRCFVGEVVKREKLRAAGTWRIDVQNTTPCAKITGLDEAPCLITSTLLSNASMEDLSSHI